MYVYDDILLLIVSYLDWPCTADQIICNVLCQLFECDLEKVRKVWRSATSFQIIEEEFLPNLLSVLPRVLRPTTKEYISSLVGVYFYTFSECSIKIYLCNNKLHRGQDQPALTMVNEHDGDMILQIWAQNDLFHRDTRDSKNNSLLPAVQFGTSWYPQTFKQEWWLYGIRVYSSPIWKVQRISHNPNPLAGMYS